MPIYEFVCKGCGHRFDILVRDIETYEAKCPECGEEAELILSPFNFQIEV